MLLIFRRRASSFVPTDLGDDLKLWLPADQITGLNDGDPVSTWTDRSGQGNDFTAAGAVRPTLQTNELNGKPGVQWDGTDDLMTSAAAVLTVTTDWSLVAVLRPSNTTANRYPVMNGVGNGYGIGTSTDTSKKGWIAGGVSIQSSAENADTDAKIYVLSRVGTTTTLHVNGTALTVADAVPTTPTGSRLGSNATGNEWAGFMFDVLMTTPKLSDANRDKLESYLGDKWGITVA